MSHIYHRLSLSVVLMAFVAVFVALNPTSRDAVRGALLVLASESQTITQRSQSDSGGQVSSGSPEDPFGRAVREMLKRQYEQRYGETAEEIRRSLGMIGPTADFVGYDAQNGRWLIAEFKEGIDVYKAWQQLENTCEAFVRTNPAAQFDLKLVVESKNYQLLQRGGRIQNFGMQNGVLGWYDPTNKFIEGIIEGAKVIVQAAP